METRLGDVLLTELRRQGIADVATWHATLMKSVRLSGGGGAQGTSQHMTIGASNMGVTDKIAIALVESMLKVVQTAEANSVEWSLLLGQNALTDRSAAHLQLLLARCGGSLRKVDLAGNKFSVGGAARIVEAHAKLVQRPELVLDDPPPTQAPPPPPAAPSIGSVKSVVSSTTNSQQAGSQPSGSVLDIAALRLRRDQLLEQEAQQAEQGTPPTAQGEQGRRAADAVTPKNAAPGKQMSMPPLTVSTKQPASRPPGSKHTSGGSTPRQPSPHHRSRSQDKLRPSERAAREATGTRATSQTKQSSKTAAAAAVASPNVTVNVSSSEDDEPPAKASRAAGQKAPGVSAAPKATSASVPLTAEMLQKRDGVAAPKFVAATDDAVSTATTETVVPDAQDFLDITANMNPAIDSVLNLGGHAEKSPEELFTILREGYSKPLKGNNFVALTVLLLSHNNLTSIPPNVLPPTLLRIDLSNNGLTAITGLERCKMLTVVNLRKNVIRKISGLEATLCVAHLFLGRNLISLVDGLAHLLLLETLDLSWNNIQHHAKLRPLSLNSSLRHLLLVGNPIVKPLGNRYRPVMRNLCPSLVALDNERLSYSRLAESRSMEWAIFAQAQELVASGSTRAPQSRPQSASRDRQHPTTSAPTSGRMPYGNLHETDFSSLQLLTRGITPPTGYASSARAAASGNALRHHSDQVHQKAKEKEKKSRPPVSRVQLVSKLSAQSQSYLEQAVVERLAAMQREKTQDPSPGTDTVVELSQTEERDLPTSGEWSGDDGGAFQSRHALQQHQQQMSKHLDPFIPAAPIRMAPSAPIAMPSAPRAASPASAPHEHRAASPSVAQGTARTAPGGADKLIRAGSQDGGGRPATRSQPLEPQHAPFASQRSDPTGEAAILRYVTKSAPRAASETKTGGDPPLRSGSAARSYSRPGEGAREHRRVSSGGSRTNSPPSPTVGPSVPAALPSKVEARPAEPEVFPLLGSNAKQRGRKSAAGSTLLVSPQRGHSQEPAAGHFAGSPEDRAGRHRRQIDKFSPIRSTLDKTDVSADDVNDLVLTMDPGQALSPLPRASKATRSAPLMPPPPPPPAPTSRRGLSPDAPEVADWMLQLEGDATAIHASLRTLLLILHTQKQQQQSHIIVGPGGAKHDLQAERERCVAIVRSSGMLDDTEIPQSVVDAFRFSLDELNDQSGHDVAAAGGRSPPPLSTMTDRSKRAAALELVRRVGATKTVMRYLVALIDARREDLLEQYVAKMRGVFS